MTPRFETINGKLCRMVEPEPLKLDSRMPCAVRYRKIFVELLEFWTCPKMPFADHRMICNSIKNGVADTSHTNMFAYDSHEIIGYPVVEGSAEWALYQMMQGKMVKNHCQVWWIEEGKIHGRSINENTHKLGGYFCQYRDYNDWVKRDLYLIGWKLYEPEPASKKGNPIMSEEDIAELNEPNSKTCHVCNGTGFVSYDDMDGITTQSCSCNHISEQPKQPLANVKKGDFVKHLDGRQLRIVEIKEPACLTSPHVRDRNKCFKCDNGNTYSVVDGCCIIAGDKILAILKPEEVKVKLSLEGTVSKDYAEPLDSFILNNADGHTRNRIKWSTIDPATAELVRELVEKE